MSGERDVKLSISAIVTLYDFMRTSDTSGKAVSNVKKRKPKNWAKEKDFEDTNSAEAALKEEGCWRVTTTNRDISGNVNRIYKCNKVRARAAQQCQAAVYLHFKSNEMGCTLYRADLPHNCGTLHPSQRKGPMTEKAKKEIISLLEYDSKIKPKNIIQCLTDKKIETPTMRQLSNFLISIRQKKFEQPKISLGEIEAFCANNRDIPENENTGYVVGYEISNNPVYFRFFVSSKTLLKSALGSSHVCCNATYKLNWQGYPLLVVGTTDRNREFHCLGVAVTSFERDKDFEFLFKTLKIGVESTTGQNYNPAAVMADGTQAISNSFKKVFESGIVLMCWSHVRKNIYKMAQKLISSKSEIDEILKDIGLLQLSRSKEDFGKAAKLLKAKYSEHSKFMAYFDNEWIKSNSNWFQGAMKMMPPTNNALKSFIDRMKRENTLRARVPLAQFKDLLLNFVKIWSSLEKPMTMEPNIDLQLWSKSYQWVCQDKSINLEKDVDGIKYIIPPKKLTELPDGPSDFDTFDDYDSYLFAGWTVKMIEDKWKRAECNCPDFYKKLVCKHTVGLAIRLKMVKPPLEQKSIPIGEKPKRGRPKCARTALIVD